jgi:hypothetical protein
MATIPIPFIVSGKGPVDSILATLGLWGSIGAFLLLIIVPYLFLAAIEDEFRIPLQGAKTIFSVGFAIIAGLLILFRQYLLLLAFIFGCLVLAGLIVYLGERSKKKNPSSIRRPSAPSGDFYIPPLRNRVASKKNNDTVIDAEYRLVDNRDDVSRR